MAKLRQVIFKAACFYSVASLVYVALVALMVKGNTTVADAYSLVLGNLAVLFGYSLVFGCLTRQSCRKAPVACCTLSCFTLRRSPPASCWQT